MKALDENRRLSFGDYLRRVREGLGLSQMDLQKRTDMDRTYISMLENRGNPSFETIRDIAAAVGITLDKFFQESPAGPQTPVLEVQFGATEPEKRYKEMTVKEQYLPIPFINNPQALYARKLTDNFVEGYWMVQKKMLEGIKEGIPVVYAPQELGAVHALVLDLADREVRPGKYFLFLVEDRLEPYRVEEHDGQLLLMPPSIVNNGQEIRIYKKTSNRFQPVGRVIFAMINLL
jgi:transcriptional regulator with XRE-family HTH domain